MADYKYGDVVLLPYLNSHERRMMAIAKSTEYENSWVFVVLSDTGSPPVGYPSGRVDHWSVSLAVNRMAVIDRV
jgi:hypothetical protein